MNNQTTNQPSKPNERAPSPSGYHFWNLYQNCPRKFELRYLYRLDKKTKPSALLFGTAFHEGKAEFYLSGSKYNALEVAENAIREQGEFYEREEDFSKDYDRCPKLLEKWINRFGSDDRKNFDVFGVELPIKVKVPYTKDFYMTMRLDAVLKEHYTNDVYIMETKTTSFSVETTEQNVYFGDQATSYIWGFKKKYPEERLIGVWPDIAYWHKNAKDTSTIKIHRGDIVERTEEDLRDYEQQLAGILTELSQRASAWKDSLYPDRMLFPRNTQRCYDYFRPCPYASICRSKIKRNSVPVNFILDETKDRSFTDEM